MRIHPTRARVNCLNTNHYNSSPGGTISLYFDPADTYTIIIQIQHWLQLCHLFFVCNLFQYSMIFFLNHMFEKGEISKGKTIYPVRANSHWQ